MTVSTSAFHALADSYLESLQSCFTSQVLKAVEQLAETLRAAWVEDRQVFICGNGGSAANALHIANDLHYGIGACGPAPRLPGLRVEALSANSAILTCLANDTGYESIYAHQLEVKAHPGDVLIVLSGSGNSSNVVRALQLGRQFGLTTFAITAYEGGDCSRLADVSIHIARNDMQIAEDSQLIVGHLCMQWLNQNKPDSIKTLSH